MDLFLRKIIYPQPHDDYRVVLKDDGLEIEIGSIGIRYGSGTTQGWTWAIDTIIPVRDTEAEGTGSNRQDCKIV